MKNSEQQKMNSQKINCQFHKHTQQRAKYVKTKQGLQANDFWNRISPKVFNDKLKSIKLECAISDSVLNITLGIG